MCAALITFVYVYIYINALTSPSPFPIMNHSHISTKSFSNCVAKKGPRSETVTLC